MRFVAPVLFAVAALIGCKDKQSAKQTQTTQGRTGSGAAGARPSLERPAVTGSGLVPVGKLSATISYSDRELEVDGDQIARFSNGLIDPQTAGTLTRRLEDRVRSDDPIGVSIDAALPYLRVTELLGALRQGGFHNIAMLTGTGTQMIPITLADAVEGEGMRPVITLRDNRLMLWSLSGMEGTMEAPKLSMQWPAGGSLQPLTKALVEICERHWPERKRAEEDRVISVQIDRRERADRVLQLLAAIRSEGTLELFPAIFLSTAL